MGNGVPTGFTDPAQFTNETAAGAPTTSGVHVVCGPEPDDGVIYVGQTGNLRQRLKQHLAGGGSVLAEQVREMLLKAGASATKDEIREWFARCTVAWREADDPVQLKRVLVQEHKPRFNRLHIPPASSTEVTDGRLLLARLTALNTAPLPTGGSAPHKPLLVLVALARLERELPRLAHFDDYASPLRELLSGRPGTSAEPAPQLPFWNLQRDGVWVVEDEQGSLLERHPNGEPPLSLIRASTVQGGLVADIYDELLGETELIGELLDGVAAHFFADEATRLVATVRSLVAKATRRTWWVNQGISYQAERDGWYVWAPQRTKAGTPVFHHTNVSRMRPGDIVLHYANKHIRAIGLVEAAPTLAIRPSELPGEPWADDGHHCVVEYFELEKPIELSEIEDRTSSVGPFDSVGGVKQGYLFEVAAERAERLAEEFGDRWPAGSPLHSDPRQYWLFQSSPTQWDLTEYLRGAAPGSETDFTLSRYRDAINLGDGVLLWQAGSDAGIYALAEVIAPPFERDRPAWREEGSPTEWATRVRLKRILHAPILKPEAQDDPDLRSLSVLSAPQGTNFRAEQSQWFAAVRRASRGSEPMAESTVALSVTLTDVCADFANRLREAGLVFGDGASHDSFVRTALISLATKRFLLLAGLSGSGKTRLGLAIGEWFGDEQRKVIPVRPDWTGPDALLGFENSLSRPIEGKHAWVVPPALEFILRAAHDSARPYLLLLDEMNLAHVERYFADVLSGMESDEAIIPNLVEKDGEWRATQQPPLAFPRNLFVIGTVNIDETTYMFSPKVLDRANTLEFRVATGELRESSSPPDPIVPASDSVIGCFLNAATTDAPASEGTSMFAGWLRELHQLLAEFDREFGHRVFFEAVRFEALLRVAGEPNSLRALDLQVLQKVLPRIHGSIREVGGVLEKLAAWAHAGPGKPVPQTFDVLQAGPGTGVLPGTVAKLQRMTRRLRANHFVSFAE